MLSRKRTLAISVVLIVFTGLTLFAALAGQTSKEAPGATPKAEPTKDTAELQAELKKDFPSVDYLNNNVADAARLKRSKKYDLMAAVLSPNITKDDSWTSFEHWDTGLTALPVKESRIVAIGKVIAVDAYLSNNKGFVYSEITLEVEKQFKNEPRQALEDGKYLKVERNGGIVRFPSGFETFYFVSGQWMPKLSHRYVFFLTNNFPAYGLQKDDLYLITAYELRDGKVFPLDHADSGTHPIATLYKGKDEAVLLNDLRVALHRPAKTSL